MDILVCVKRVPGTGSSVPITDDGLSVDTRHLGFTIGPHEECAVEEAIRLTDTHGGEVTVLTAGPAEAAEQLRYALAMGAHHGVLADTGTTDLDPQATATVLATALTQLRADGRDFDLILFGNESADAGNYQVGIRVACELGLSIVGGIKGIDVDTDARRVRLRRDTPEGIEVYEAALPTAVAVKEGLNLPRYPSVRGRIRSRKAQLRPVEVTPLPGGLRKLRLRPAPDKGEATVVLGHGPDAAIAVADLFDELGVTP
ncbi:electron transfer flavoprotein subunit beta/FixA family protein [Stackebrandtia nassauensis]|uniref:Electron transfer flavoprotein alpha/beta-subunit n=1 Tax=Stackebrandtia nassauensis (strain DSM 44728 / CIP 108903 / NRRL B-16338 / NBRC 102104 / LLR-40K-21) TaxID=446470 RepID=D3PYF2_STANL|nr:electron transfer flavoprotein subunit beta/FixA family protein [Stackebrandtia nassauensis]ADD41519.1 Electron transfer flavoprotein alpha/beta- subunit [Stackebrandtia nassauensis DSM 44728]